MLLRKLKENYKLIFFLLGLSSCKNDLDKNLFIEQLYVPNSVYTIEDRGKTLSVKNDYFIIHGFKRNDFVKAYIDSFVTMHKKKETAIYRQYSIGFYKYSEYTNIEHLAKNPRDLARYSNENDLVYIYSYSENKLSFFEYKNGKRIYPISNITVE